MCIDTYDAPYTRVLMEARAEIVDDNWEVPSPDKAIRYLGDEAGRKWGKAAAATLASCGHRVCLAQLPEGVDPNDLLAASTAGGAA